MGEDRQPYVYTRDDRSHVVSYSNSYSDSWILESLFILLCPCYEVKSTPCFRFIFAYDSYRGSCQKRVTLGDHCQEHVYFNSFVFLVIIFFLTWTVTVTQYLLIEIVYNLDYPIMFPHVCFFAPQIQNIPERIIMISTPRLR